MLEIIKTRDNEKVINAMIEGRQTSVWSMIRHEEKKLNFNDDALIIDEYGATIKTHIFMNRMLDIDDDFAQKVNEVLYGMEKDNYDECIKKIIDMGYDIDTEGWLCGSGYTYNDPDHCLLSRDIAYSIFEHEGDSYAFVEVHYGADARVGFGAMVCFKIEDLDYFFDGMNADLYDYETHESYTFFDEISYDENKKIFIADETGNELEVYTSSNGY